MDITSPTKPPRGVKNSKETSGLLMAVIRTLSTSESNEQRDLERAKLEREYKKCDQRLNELVSIHKQDLEQVMQLFIQMSTMITNTRDKLRCIKEMLIACKTLLSCRRDELKKLWFEGVEHKHVLQLLNEIEELKEVPSKLAHFLANKDYLNGTKILVLALNAGDGDLEGVEALNELKTELQVKKEKLHEMLLWEISNIVYLEPVKTLDCSSNNQIITREKFRWRQKILDSSSISNSFEKSSSVSYDIELRMLVECLGLLNKLNESIESIKSKMQDEILNVVNLVSKAVAANSGNNHPLIKLLEMLIDQLRKIAVRFKSLLNAFGEVSKKCQVTLSPVNGSDIWNTIQNVLQLLLTDYLDIQNTANDPTPTPGYPDQAADISTFFARRRIQRPRKFPLFKFEYSSNVNFLSKEQQAAVALSENKQRGKVLICPPEPFNITIVYKTLQKFIEEIESSLSLPSGKSCTLNTFVNDYVKDAFIGREHTRISMKIETATKSTNAWRAPITPNEVSQVGLLKPILQSTYQVSNALKELETLLDSLPRHKIEVLEILVNLIKNFVETCSAAYRGIIQPEPEDKRLCSAAWLKDEDISRFLKSLPNWIDLQAQKSFYHSARPLKREDTTEEESPEDVRQRNIKEAEILASNLGEGGIGPHEIISDPSQLKCLAQLQESMEWFAFRVLQINVNIKKRIHESQNEPNNLNKYLSLLSNLSEEFEDLASTCLLVLHLEIRVQCFHYLLPRGFVSGKTKDNSHDPDPRVLDLSRVLVSVDEALSPSLQPRKCKYIFEGLGHLIAKILMSSAQYLEKIDESAIHKMCRNIFTLQQTLSNITMTREVALDHARRYFQLFFMTQEDILNQVLEKGPEFSELEYINALQLINRTYNDQEDPSVAQKYLQRLSDILGEVGVTV
ncbi:unnamed protein product [Nezara viridula]|uniref:Exocyst complex component Sec8 n=1 Tax=Nezara viridula TaxID=85310 RepID=A0A9P0MUY3_NEZVI|nr:unnamed protein product [Nezara viridula]